MKALKLFVGLLLLPVAWVLTATLGALLASLRPSSGADIPTAAWALAAGGLLWFLIYFSLSPPVRAYVLAHELTHALWGMMMGARVSRLRVRASGGSVSLSKTNFLIALAPYFFPLYTALVIVLYYSLIPFWPVEKAYPWWMGAIAFTWVFHVTFTVTTLAIRQSDILQHGRIFSYAVIYCANLAGVCLWIVMVSPATITQLANLLRTHGVHAARHIGQAAQTAFHWIAGLLSGPSIQ